MNGPCNFQGFHGPAPAASVMRSRIVELTAEGRAIAIAWREHVRVALGKRIWRWPAAKQEAIADAMAELCRRLRSPEYY